MQFTWIIKKNPAHIFFKWYQTTLKRLAPNFSVKAAAACVCNMPTKALLSPLTEFICISSATVTQRGAVCPLTSQLTNCLTIIACTPFYTTLPDSAFASCGTRAANIPSVTSPRVYSAVFFPPFLFIIEHCSLQHYRGDAGSPVVTQVGYLWPPATSMSLFHGWQKECQSSSSSGDLWPAAAHGAHDPRSWVSDVVSLKAETYRQPELSRGPDRRRG